LSIFDRTVGWVAKPSVLQGGKVYCWVLFLNPAYLYWPRQTPDIEAKYMTNLYLELPSEISPEDAKVLLAIKLWETGRLSLGQAAVVAGYSKRAFMDCSSRFLS